LDEARLAALAPDADRVEIRRHLDLIPTICRGGPDSGPISALSQAERFHWLVSPRSSVIQTSPVHCGLADDPESALRGLVARLVRVGVSDMPNLDSDETNRSGGGCPGIGVGQEKSPG